MAVMDQNYPLHQASRDPDEIWGNRLSIRCACENSHPLWNKKCPGCRRKNPLRGLIKKRKKLERWFDRKIESEIIPAMDKTDLLQELVRSFDGNLAEIVHRPFPERRKNEDINKYLKRVASFFPTMFKTTSPKQTAIKLSDAIPRASTAIARTALTESLAVLKLATGGAPVNPDALLVSKQALQVNEDLLELCKPYLEALRTLQLSHSRMVTAYGPARDIFRREIDSGRAKTLWNKARSMMTSSGQYIRFPTAIWKDTEELEKIKRLDINLAKFLEQSQNFRKQLPKLRERTRVLNKTYRLSLRRHMADTLVAMTIQAPPSDSKVMTKRLLSQKGVSSWVWRLLFGVRVQGNK